MKKATLILMFLIGVSINSFADFIIHTYYINQNPQGCHNFFVVITYDNGDGMGEIYQTSGHVSVGDGCQEKYTIVPDENGIIPLDQALATNEVINKFLEDTQSYGITSNDLWNTSTIDIFCNPDKGKVIVARDSGSIDFVEIKNLQGTLVASFQAQLNSTSEMFDINSLPAGTYVAGAGKGSTVLFTKQVLKY